MVSWKDPMAHRYGQFLHRGFTGDKKNRKYNQSYQKKQFATTYHNGKKFIETEQRPILKSFYKPFPPATGSPTKLTCRTADLKSFLIISAALLKVKANCGTCQRKTKMSGFLGENIDSSLGAQMERKGIQELGIKE